jgi:hypothetical protein
VKKTVAGISSSASIGDAVKQLSSLAPALESLATATTTTVDAIQSGSSAMQEGFKKANSCKPYRR